jgi:hypothetical protein
MAKHSPAVATGAHVSIIGHITKDEPRRRMSEAEFFNGFGNRFLWTCAQRSKILPDSEGIESAGLADLVSQLRETADWARQSRLSGFRASASLSSFSLLLCLRGVCYIPQNRIGIVEKFWSTRGSLREGRIIALNPEAGFQADILRGGIHFGFYPWQYRIRRQPLVTVGEGKLAYVYARDGKPLLATQTLGRVVECNGRLAWMRN